MGYDGDISLSLMFWCTEDLFVPRGSFVWWRLLVPLKSLVPLYVINENGVDSRQVSFVFMVSRRVLIYLCFFSCA